MCRPHGLPLLCLAEVAKWNPIRHCAPQWTDRVAPDRIYNGSLGNLSGLHHDYSTWDELYKDDDGEYMNAWNSPTSSNAPIPFKKLKTIAFSSSATVLSQVATILIPGADTIGIFLLPNSACKI